VSFTLNFTKCNKILGDSEIAKDYGSRIEGFMCDVGLLNFLLLSFRKAGQSGDQILVGARFSTPIQPPLQRVLGLFPGVALTTHSHLLPRLKKEYSYISACPLDLHYLF
jgi:hypothetical protein